MPIADPLTLYTSCASDSEGAKEDAVDEGNETGKMAIRHRSRMSMSMSRMSRMSRMSN